MSATQHHAKLGSMIGKLMLAHSDAQPISPEHKSIHSALEKAQNHLHQSSEEFKSGNHDKSIGSFHAATAAYMHASLLSGLAHDHPNKNVLVPGNTEKDAPYSVRAGQINRSGYSEKGNWEYAADLRDHYTDSVKALGNKKN